MIKKILIIAVFAIASIQLLAQDNILLTGFVRNYTGVLTKEPNDFSIIQNTLNLYIEKRADKVAFKVNPFLFYFSDRDLELGLREAYVDMYFDNFDLRVGKQQIIWGKAEGVFITDIVSPKDMREFLLPNFNEIRIGLTSMRLNYYKGNNTFEFVIAPVFTPTLMPEKSSIWAPKMDFPIQPTWDYSDSEITPKLENSEIYARYSLMASSFDFEIVGGYFFYDDPAIHLTKQIDPETMQLSGLTARPEYHRVSMVGGSFSKPISGLIVRGEGAYYNGRYFQTEDPSIFDATTQKNNLHYMIGLDYNWAGINLSAQFIQEYIINYDHEMKNDEFTNTMTFLAKKDFFREKLWIELFSYIGINNEDALLRPRLIYDFADGFEVQAGANIFIGEKGQFGQYNDNDMIYFRFKYSF